MLRLSDGQQGAPSVWAADINVTSLLDPGNGVCDLAECTLREAIVLANTNAGGDWIKLGVNGTITLTTALPAISDHLTIDGSGRKLQIDGGGIFRVISATAPLTLTNITIQHGLAAEAGGGGAYFGAAAVLTSVSFTANTATNANLGAGAFFAGPTRIISATFSANSGGSGGGAYFQSTASVSGTTFITNTVTQGMGGGAFFEQPAWITNTVFVGNVGGEAGGGAYFAGAANLLNVSFVENESPAGYGGGAVLAGPASTVTDSLFDSNSAQGDGGGLALADFQAPASATLATNRLWRNDAGGHGGGLFVAGGVTALVDNTIIAANSAQTPNAAADIGVAGVGTQLIGRHNTLSSGTPSSGVALAAGSTEVGQTVTLTNTIFNGYAVGVLAGAFTPTVQLDSVLWSAVATPLQGSGITVSNAVTGSAAFTNPILRNFHLTSASAAIDAGVTTGLSLDFEGDPRSGLGPDLGADEFIAGVDPGAPEPVDDTATTPEDTPVTIIALENDADPNNDTLVVSAVGTPANGQATPSGTVAVVYTPTLNFYGTDVFTYSVTDQVFTSTALISVTITPVNDAPTISAISPITIGSGSVSSPLPFTVGDVESGGAVTVTAASDNLTLVPQANLVLGGTGTNRTVTVSAPLGRGGQATITLTVADDQAATTMTSFLVTVNGRVLFPLIRR